MTDKKQPINKYKLDAGSAKLLDFDCLAKPDDHVEIVLWNNGEGFDVSITSDGVQHFELTWGQFKAIKKIIKELDQ